MSRVLVYSNDRVGRTMSGPGIRSYHFAAELAKTFDVTLMAPNGPDHVPHGVMALPSPPPDKLDDALDSYGVVVSQYLPPRTMRRLARRGTRTIYDLYVPFLSEGLAAYADGGDRDLGRLHWRAGQAVQQTALATGSAFVCASERQRDLYVGMLAALGRIGPDEYRADPTLRELIDVVPYGLATEPPEDHGRRVLRGARENAGDKVLLWAGGIWDWTDPLTVIQAAARAHSDVRLVLLGRKHPDLPESSMATRALELARSLDVLDRRVFFEDAWVPYEDRAAYLVDSDVGVSAHFDSLETRYAFRTRILDHLWAGLPTIATRGDVLGDLVADRGAGRAVAAQDVDGWVEAIEHLGDPAVHARMVESAERIRDEFTWTAVAQPLIRLAGSAAPPHRNRVRLPRGGGIELRLRTLYSSRGALGSLRRVVEKAVNGARRAVAP